MPWLEYPEHKSAFKDFNIFSDCHIRNSERAAQFTIIDYLAMIMGDHAPETIKSAGRNINTQLGNISFKKRGDILFSPPYAYIIIFRSKGKRKAAPYPELLNLSRENIMDSKSSEVILGNPSSQAFRSLIYQIPRSASKYKVTLFRYCINQISN